MITNYQILGVSNTASYSEIKEAYKRLVKILHPDKAVWVLPEQVKVCENVFKLVDNAYKILIDANQKAAYDTYLKTAPTSPVAVDESFFALWKSLQDQFAKSKRQNEESYIHDLDFTHQSVETKQSEVKQQETMRTVYQFECSHPKTAYSINVVNSKNNVFRFEHYSDGSVIATLCNTHLYADPLLIKLKRELDKTYKILLKISKQKDSMHICFASGMKHRSPKNNSGSPKSVLELIMDYDLGLQQTNPKAESQKKQHESSEAKKRKAEFDNIKKESKNAVPIKKCKKEEEEEDGSESIYSLFTVFTPSPSSQHVDARTESVAVKHGSLNK